MRDFPLANLTYKESQVTATTKHEIPLLPPKDQSDTIRPFSWAVVLAPTSMNDSEERSDEETQVGLPASCPAPGRQRSGSKCSSMKGDPSIYGSGLGINDGE